MTISHGLILFELGLLFVKAKIILTDMDNFMDVGEVIYRQTGATSWDSSVICPLVQFVPLQFEEWVHADMVQYLKSANMPMLEFRLYSCVISLVSFRLLFLGHLIILHMTWHPDLSQCW